jgi:hypothetical protein
MRTIASLLLLAAASSVAAQNFGALFDDCRFNDQSPTDNLTSLCLLGVTEAREPEWCAEIDPAYGKAAAEAHRTWLGRNAEFIRDFQWACAARIQRAYGQDDAAIVTARRDAKVRHEELKTQFGPTDCSTFIHYKNEEGKHPYVPPPFLRSIRECAVRSTQGPNR